ncbi:MAG: S8 family serine peptidase [Chloroflexaceae bacterium]
MLRILICACALMLFAVAWGLLPPRSEARFQEADTPWSSPPPARPSWLREALHGAPRNASPTAPGAYIVVLADPPLAAYEDDRPGLAATTPRARNEPRLDTASPAARAYLAYLHARQDEALARVSVVLERAVTPRARFLYALNGVSLTLTPEEAARVATLAGVRLVQPDEPRRLATDVGPTLIGAAQPDLGPTLFSARLAPARGAAADAAAQPCAPAGPPCQDRAALPAASPRAAMPQTAPDVAPSSTEPASHQALPERTGWAVVTYSAPTRRLALQLAHGELSGPPVAASLLVTAPGQPDSVALDLMPLAVPEGRFYAGELTLTDTPELSAAAIERALLAGNTVLQITTAAQPAGEIRGQVVPARGEGIVTGVIDSGIDPYAPAFAPRGDDGFLAVNPYGRFLGVCDPARPDFNPTFPCNAKVIGAYTFPATAATGDPFGRPSPFDDNGHGSHVASTLAGHVQATSAVAGVATGPLAGVAPHATIVAYDACGIRGSFCPLEAILQAIDQAVADGVDVINFSIGGFATEPWRDAEALALLGALEGGTLVAVAAGNAGPDPGSITAPANAPWVLSIGATSHGRRFVRDLGPFGGGAGPAPPLVTGAGFGAEALPLTPIVDAATLPSADGPSNPACLPFAGHVRLQGAIVVCRQQIDPERAAGYAATAGAGGLVIIWPDTFGAFVPIKPLALPTVHLDATQGAQLLAWLARGSGHQAALGPARRDPGGPADVVVWFSSRGPNRTAPGTLKPDLLAPGLNILATTIGSRPGAPAYALLSGTSMATPHVAGAAALIRQVHPDWTPTEIRAALMTTATTATTADGAPALALAAGAGRVQVDRAARAGLLLDETPAGFRAVDPLGGGDPTRLNLPAFASPACLEQCVFTRVFRNPLPVTTTWSATATGAPELTFSVEPEQLTLAPGATRAVTITARIARDAFRPEGTYLSGAISFSEARGLAPPARLPAALNALSAILPPAVSVRTAESRGSVTLTGLRTVSAEALTLRVFGLSRGEVHTLRVPQDPTPGNPLDGTAGVARLDIALPAGTPRVRLEVGRTTARDVDLFVFADGLNGPADGVPELEEAICISAGGSNAEFCDLRLNHAPAQTLIVLVQNYSGSGQAEDRVDLAVTIVPPESLGNAGATGPVTVRAGEPFGLSVAWNLLGERPPPDRYLGVLQLSSNPDPARAGDLGSIPIDVVYVRQWLFMPSIYGRWQ